MRFSSLKLGRSRSVIRCSMSCWCRSQPQLEAIWKPIWISKSLVNNSSRLKFPIFRTSTSLCNSRTSVGDVQVFHLEFNQQSAPIEKMRFGACKDRLRPKTLGIDLVQTNTVPSEHKLRKRKNMRQCFKSKWLWKRSRVNHNNSNNCLCQINFLINVAHLNNSILWDRL